MLPPAEQESAISAPDLHTIKNNLLRQLAPQELAAISIDLLPVDLPKDFLIAAENVEGEG